MRCKFLGVSSSSTIIKPNTKGKKYRSPNLSRSIELSRKLHLEDSTGYIDPLVAIGEIGGTKQLTMDKRPFSRKSSHLWENHRRTKDDGKGRGQTELEREASTKLNENDGKLDGDYGTVWYGSCY